MLGSSMYLPTGHCPGAPGGRVSSPGNTGTPPPPWTWGLVPSHFSRNTRLSNVLPPHKMPPVVCIVVSCLIFKAGDRHEHLTGRCRLH